ncbi:Quinoprotein glucose dehydrogenase B precursor [Phycisphaerae bacterium RAS1]|nr:Quinoprotein glucose dehydrogenase B precursor [Phycisphaerae bacterium RAS1]
MRIATPIGLMAVAGMFISGGGLAAAAKAQTVSDSRLTVQTVASGLDLPTSIAFIGANELLVGEKNTGRVKRVVNGSIVGTVLDLPVASADTHGLLGMTTDPAFATNHLVYVYYSLAAADGGEWIENRVQRFTWDGQSLIGLAEPPIIRFPADPGQTNTGCEGGKIAFGSDGKLYGTTGDLMRGTFDNPRIEQNTAMSASARAGGIFRINADGTYPEDNPFSGSDDKSLRRWFAYGVRQSYGLDFDRRSGQLWITENGPEVYDEISRVTAGYNSGWLKIMGPDARNAQFTQNDFASYDWTDLMALDGSHYSDPEFSFLQPIGITALLFLDSVRYPWYLRGRAFVGDYNFGKLYLFEPSGDRLSLVTAGDAGDKVADTDDERESLVWGNGWGVTTDLKLGPDGFIYHVSLTDGAVRRIRPSIVTGDLNADDVVDNRDIDPFILALIDPTAFVQQFPGIDANIIGDANGDGALNILDINGFVELVRGK